MLLSLDPKPQFMFYGLKSFRKVLVVLMQWKSTGMLTSRRGFGVGALLLCSSILVSGCSKSGIERLPVFPVDGQVTRDGQPLSGALVVLHPQGNLDARALPARATTDAEGKFKATTYDTGDGAAEGEYAITVELYETVEVDGNLVPGPNVLDASLASPTTSQLKVLVGKGPTTVPKIEVVR